MLLIKTDIMRQATKVYIRTSAKSARVDQYLSIYKTSIFVYSVSPQDSMHFITTANI